MRKLLKDTGEQRFSKWPLTFRAESRNIAAVVSSIRGKQRRLDETFF